jgi:hypothetical protein
MSLATRRHPYNARFKGPTMTPQRKQEIEKRRRRAHKLREMNQRTKRKR